MAFELFPFPYWLSGLAIVLSGSWFWRQRHSGYGVPAIAVLGTCLVWYLGDANYNDLDSYARRFDSETISEAWWQVFLFVLSFSFLVPKVFSITNDRIGYNESNILKLSTKSIINSHDFQEALTRFHKVLVIVWMILMTLALIRVDYDIKGLFFPWLGHMRNPWVRGRIGGGIDALYSLAQYFQIFLTAGFGVIAAISRDPRTRYTALVICILALPYFLFGRTRNTMLAVGVPGILAWVFFRVKGGLAIKAVVMLVAFLMIENWFGFVLENRRIGVAAMFAEEDASLLEQNRKHLGLNMFQELAWINRFIEEGLYQPNWGERYFAEAVNPIPRVLWSDKPKIGIDYAILRGYGDGSVSNAGVSTSISTGMIGQGVVNFGRFFGPIAAAALMAMWVALLGRQDLLAGNNPAHLLLYGLGLILTFNMGRDITLLVLYPFLFGLLFILWWERFIAPKRKRRVRKPETGISVFRRPKKGD